MSAFEKKLAEGIVELIEEVVRIRPRLERPLKKLQRALWEEVDRDG